MSTLVLRLAGPMQAWGTASRFAYRVTDPYPSKSGVLGLLAAAEGRRRVDPIEDLLELRFGVRVDQPGRVIRDFHTAMSLDKRKSFPLTHRYYLADAVFVAALEGPDALIGSLEDAIRRPKFPLYLGRRSCPPAGPLCLSIVNRSAADALESFDADDGIPWQASAWWRRRQGQRIELEVVRDANRDEAASNLVHDSPLSFDPHHRRYATRAVVHQWTSTANPDGVREHDPWSMWGGA